MEIEATEFGRQLDIHTQREFISGIQTLDKVVNILSQANESTSAVKMKGIAKKLTSLVRQAYQHFTRASQLSKGETARISGIIEARVVEISKLKDYVSEKQTGILKLSEKLNSLNAQIDANEKELGEARGSLDRANGRLRERRDDLKKKERDRDIVTGVGIGITAIPIFGWIAGLTMVAVSLTAMQDAVNAAESNVDSARDDVRSCENRLSDKKKNRDDLQQQLSKETAEKEGTEKEVEVLKADLLHLQEEQKSSTIVKEKLEKTCHFMTNIWGKSKVLKMETLNAYSLEPLFAPLKEIAEMLTPEEQKKLKETTCLFKEVVLYNMSSKMKAICQKIECDVVVENTKNKSRCVLL